MKQKTNMKVFESVVMKLSGRTFVAGCYNTISLPVMMDENMLNEAFGEDNWSLKYLSDASFDDESLSLEFSDYTQQQAPYFFPYTPYLLKLNTEVKEPIIFAYAFDYEYFQSFITNSSHNGVSFQPTALGPVQVGSKGDDIESMLFLGANNTLYHPTAMPATIKAFRGYFRLEEQVYYAAKRIKLNIDGETTDISDIAGDAFDSVTGNGEWFTLQGVKLNGKPSATGTYINNGRKVMVK